MIHLDLDDDESESRLGRKNEWMVLSGNCDDDVDHGDGFGGDEHQNDDDVNEVDEMKLNLLEQKPELQLAPEVDRRATNRWKGQGGSPRPGINIVVISY